jgi:hypothetical protein
VRSVRDWFPIRALTTACGAAALAVLLPAVGHAQAAALDDTPSVTVGGTIFGDYSYTDAPTATDASGNTYHPNGFSVTRTYINITGQLSHVVSFRLTPDVTRETGSGSSLNGSLDFRLKYAFAQVNLGDWMTKGSWVRLGQQQTPLVDYQEGIYRYRFQGTTFVEREGYLTSSDAGASFHYAFAKDYGDVHVGLYNGEGYSHAEANDRKALQVRATVRPFSEGGAALHGLRATVFYDGDSYTRDATRRRVLGELTYEHRYVNAGFDYLDTRDQPTSAAPELRGRGYSFWITPKLGAGFEVLVRYDHMTPDTTLDDQVRTRTIAGVSRWFRYSGGLTSALLVDYEQVNGDDFTPAQPEQRRIAVHALLNF